MGSRRRHPTDARPTASGDDKRAFVVGSGRRPEPPPPVRRSTGRSVPMTATCCRAGIALSPDGRTLAVGHSDGMVDLVDARTLRRSAQLPRAARLRRRPRLQPGRPPARRHRAVRAALTLWDTRTLRARRRATGPAHHEPDARLLARRRVAGQPPNSATVDDRADTWAAHVRVWDLQPARRRRGSTSRSSAPAITFSPDGRLLALATWSLRPPRSGTPAAGALVA